MFRRNMASNPENPLRAILTISETQINIADNSDNLWNPNKCC